MSDTLKVCAKSAKISELFFEKNKKEQNKKIGKWNKLEKMKKEIGKKRGKLCKIEKRFVDRLLRV